MIALLDTNALLWAAYAPGNLTAPAEQAYFEAQKIHVSMVSLWEIGLKMSRGGFHGFRIPIDWEKSLWSWMMEQGFEVLGVELADCRMIQDLPYHHKDPFDRMLIAQALRGNFSVIGIDENFDAYGVRRIW